MDGSGVTTIVRSDYTIPTPGGLYIHSMVMDSTDMYLYVFGGAGFAFINYGIFYVVFNG